ncbi:MAG: sortase, partial [Firmicutes bacterium]|nr:sortase [Bacillota bacterium]
EPLDNYDEVLDFLKKVSSPDGLNIGMRHISLSTCGLVERMRRSAQEGLGATGGQDQEVPDYVRNPDMEMPTVQIDGEAYIGVLEFPSLSVSLPVISDWSAAKLRTAPCRYTGSAYRDNLVIAGHNYRTHFGKLQNLSLGDTVLFFDADGNQFAYEVAGVEELDSTAIEEMVTGDWDLTLFTCTVGGTTRLAVRCEALDALPARYAEE